MEGKGTCDVLVCAGGHAVAEVDGKHGDVVVRDRPQPHLVPSVHLKTWRGIFLDFVNLITTMPSRHIGDQVHKVDFFPIAR